MISRCRRDEDDREQRAVATTRHFNTRDRDDKIASTISTPARSQRVTRIQLLRTNLLLQINLHEKEQRPGTHV